MPDTTQRGSRSPRDLLVLGLFATSLVVSICQPLTQADGVTDVAVWVEHIKALQPRLKPGSTVFIQPPWRDDVLDELDRLAKQGEPVLPPDVKVTVALARAHKSWPGHVMLVADQNHPLPASLKDRLDHLSDDKLTKKDGLLIAEFGTSPPTLAPSRASQLDGLLARARVSVSTGSSVTRCVYQPGSGRHECPGEPEWMYVGPYNMRTGGQSKRCLWAHPPAKGSLDVTFPAVTLQGALELQHALADGAVRNGGSPVDVRVLVADQEIGRSQRTNAVTFAQRLFATTPGEVADITFQISARHDGARHHCFTARLLEKMP